MEYTGAEAIDKALKDRFSAIIRMEFLSVEEETEVLTGRTSVDKASAIKLAKSCCPSEAIVCWRGI